MTSDSGSASRSTLNDYQKRRVRVTCQHIDGLLADAEEAFASLESQRPFPKYIADLSIEERRVVKSFFARIRASLVQVTEQQNVPPEPPEIPLSRVVRTALLFADVSVEELRPRHMKGYGAVPSEAAEQLLAIAQQLEDIVMEADKYLASVAPVHPEDTSETHG